MLFEGKIAAFARVQEENNLKPHSKYRPACQELNSGPSDGGAEAVTTTRLCLVVVTFSFPCLCNKSVILFVLYVVYYLSCL